MRRLIGHTKTVRGVTYTPGGHVVSCGDDKTVRAWDVVTGEEILAIRAESVVYAVAASPDGKTLAYAGRHVRPDAGFNSVHLLDYRENRPVGLCAWPMGAIAKSIWSLSFSANGGFLAAACRVMANGGMLDGGGARWWLIPPQYAQGDLPDLKAYAVRFAPSGTALAVTREGEVGVLDDPEGDECVTYKLPSTWAAAVAFTQGGRGICIAANSFLLMGDVVGSLKLRRIKTGARTVTALAVSPDGRTVLAGGRPGLVERYDAESGKLLGAYDLELGGVNALAFAPDGFTFAVGGEGGLLLCDAEF